MAEHITLINPDPARYRGNFVMTQMAEDMLRSLQHVHRSDAGELTMIAAIPGAGKTKAMHYFLHNTPGTIYHQIVVGQNKINIVMADLMSRLDLGEPTSRLQREDRERIADAIGPNNVLIIDEAQYLVRRDPRISATSETFEWLRALAEEGCFSIVFCGDLALTGAIDRLPQLRRRVVRPVVIRKVPKADVEAVAAHHGVTDKTAIDALFGVSGRYGGLGDVTKTVRHAMKLANSQTPDPVHIAAAIEDLKLTAKGGV